MINGFLFLLSVFYIFDVPFFFTIVSYVIIVGTPLICRAEFKFSKFFRKGGGFIFFHRKGEVCKIGEVVLKRGYQSF